MLHGLDSLIQSKTNINVVSADDPLTCVAIGTGKYVDYLAKHPY